MMVMMVGVMMMVEERRRVHRAQRKGVDQEAWYMFDVVVVVCVCDHAQCTTYCCE